MSSTAFQTYAPRRAVIVSWRVLLLGVTELVLGGPREVPLWKGEAPAEPKSIVSVQLSFFAHNLSPSIPDAEDKNG